jgi:hypothetical protein
MILLGNTFLINYVAIEGMRYQHKQQGLNSAVVRIKASMITYIALQLGV